MTTATPEKADGLKALQVAIEEIEKTIKSMGGVFQIQMAVSIVTFVIYSLTRFNNLIVHKSRRLELLLVNIPR